MIRNLPAQWDLEADVVSIGSGIGGLAAAITAHENGASAIVLERADKVGGVTALSMGEVWVAGNRTRSNGMRSTRCLLHTPTRRRMSRSRRLRRKGRHRRSLIRSRSAV